MEPDGSAAITEGKRCEQCEQWKPFSAFHRRKNKTDGRMRICADCYTANLQETYQRQREHMQQWEEEHKRQEEEKRRQEEERRRQEEERHAHYQQVLDAWYQQQPDRQCIACKRTLPASDFGYTYCIKREEEDIWLPAALHQRCQSCHEAYRNRNNRINPQCPMCGIRRQGHAFLREYQGHRLDLIKVCCETCIPRFKVLPEAEQLRRLRNAIKHVYGDYAVIYALHYDASNTVHHIGRTKHLTRRMAEYRRKNWYKPIHHYNVLEEVTPGGLSMERESRWMLHALKHGWPIDNFELLKTDEDGLGGQRIQAELIQAVADIESLTAPHLFHFVRIHALAENPTPGTVVRHPRSLEMEELAQFLCAEFSPMSHATTTILSC